MWEGRSLGLYSYLNEIHQVGLSILSLSILQGVQPYAVDEAEWWPHFSFIMPQNQNKK